MNELKQMAAFVSNFKLHQAPDEVLHAATSCVLDTIGVALGAAQNPFLDSLRQSYLKFERGLTGEIPVWGTNLQLPLRTAVFFNAMGSHLLELDDVHTSSKTHIGTVVIPAAWGLAQQLNKSGAQFLEAVICGYEVMARIGMGFGVSSHRNKGWHVTGTAGTFGAAAACGKLLNFTTEQLIHCFGLAGTQSCSTWAFISDGATNKILHPGRAAVNGLESAFLTLGGMTGSQNILNAKDGGLFPMMSDSYDYTKVNANLGNTYEILHMDKKPYPCCRSTHCAIDAALRIREKHKPNIHDIDQILIDTYLVGVKQCGLSESSIHPQFAADAKFSTPYTVACALLNGCVELGDFSSTQICKPERQELLQKVVVRENSDFTRHYPEHWGCQMKIILKDRSQYVETVTDASGSVDSPLSAQQFSAKIIACCSTLTPTQISVLTNRILHLQHEKQLPALPLT